jgi:hypothetical protein
MGIRKSILTSGGFASAIGICLATLSAGTLVVFSVIAAGVGLGEPSAAPSVARAARGETPSAITFPSTGRSTAENQVTRAGDTSLLDVIGSAGTALDPGTALDESVAANSANGSAQTAAPDNSGAADEGPDQVALVPDIDLGVDNALGPALRSPRIKRGARPGKDSPKPDGGKDKDDDKVVGRRDDDDDPDHAPDDDDDDDDSDSSGASDGSGLERVHAKAGKVKAKAKAKGHSKSAGEHKGDRDKRHDSHHSHDSDSSDT